MELSEFIENLEQKSGIASVSEINDEDEFESVAVRVEFDTNPYNGGLNREIGDMAEELGMEIVKRKDNSDGMPVVYYA